MLPEAYISWPIWSQSFQEYLEIKAENTTEEKVVKQYEHWPCHPSLMSY